MPALRQIRSHTALRGVAALLVVFYHLQLGTQTRLPIEDATSFFRRGYLWVDLFFVLSGFILSYVNRVETMARFGRADAVAFWRSRFARIYPLHICCLAVFALVMALLTVLTEATGHYPPVNWSSENVALLTAQALLLNVWVDRAGSWNVPTWSISAEAVAYLLFPLLVTWRARRPVIATAVIVGAPVAFFAFVGATTGVLDVIGGPFAILRCLAGFLLGMLVHQGRALSVRLDDGVLSVMQAAAMAGIVGVLATGVSDPLVIPLFVVLVGTTWEDRGLLSRLLARRPLLWLGDISYSVYLLHVPTMAILSLGWIRLMQHVAPAPLVERVAWIALVLFAVVSLARLTYNFVERPARQWLARRLLGHRVPPIVTSPAAP